jgi:hypothetical protein
MYHLYMCYMSMVVVGIASTQVPWNSVQRHMVKFGKKSRSNIWQPLPAATADSASPEKAKPLQLLQQPQPQPQQQLQLQNDQQLDKMKITFFFLFLYHCLSVALTVPLSIIAYCILRLCTHTNKRSAH